MTAGIRKPSYLMRQQYQDEHCNKALLVTGDKYEYEIEASIEEWKDFLRTWFLEDVIEPLQ